MASDNEMRAAGIHLPIGSDYIRDGDNAIVANARVLWDRIEDARDYRGKLSVSDSLTTLETGRYWVGNAIVAEALGLPIIQQGEVRITRPDPGIGSVQFLSRTRPAREFRAAIFTNGLDEWVESGRAPEQRTAGVALTHSRGSGIDTRPLVTARIPVRFGAPVRRLRAVFRNFDYRTGQALSGDLRLNGVAWGEQQIDADGSMTGLFPEAPTILSSAIDAPSDGSAFATPWVDVDAKPGTEYLLSYTVEGDGTDKVWPMGFCFTNTQRSGWVTEGVTTATPQSLVPLAVHLEVELDEHVPVYAYIGDSLTAGHSAERPGYDSWPQQHARAQGAIPQVYSHPGSSLPAWSDPDNAEYARFSEVDRPDRLYFALGFNDLGSSVDLAEMQSRTLATLQTAMSYTTKHVHLTTILPAATELESESVREPFNEWLQVELPGNALAALDLHSVIVDPATGRTDARWSAAPGNSHLSRAGYARVAAAAGS